MSESASMILDDGRVLPRKVSRDDDIASVATARASRGV